MTIEVFDDFFDEFTFQKIKNLIDSCELKWSRSTIINEEEYPKDVPLKILMDKKYNHQFVHYLYDFNLPQSNFYSDILDPFIRSLKSIVPIRAFLRAKINFNPCTEKIIEHALHHDFVPDEYPDLKTVLFYVNTNDGYTLFEDGDKIKSVENRCVIMSKNILHTGTSCTNNFGRIVIAINYL